MTAIRIKSGCDGQIVGNMRDRINGIPRNSPENTGKLRKAGRQIASP